MRLIVIFEKTGRMKYISHLDVMRTMQRAFNRADIPLEYTQGFNPHPKFSFAAPLALGVTGLGELMDISLREKVEPSEFARNMNQYLPSGLRIVACGLEKEKKPSLMSAVALADYEITLSEPIVDLDHKIKALLMSETVMVEKKTKKGMREVDIRPMVNLLTAKSEQCIECCVATGSKNNLNPKILLNALLSGSKIMYYNITRKKLYTQENNEWVDYLMWMQEDSVWVNK